VPGSRQLESVRTTPATHRGVERSLCSPAVSSDERFSRPKNSNFRQPANRPNGKNAHLPQTDLSGFITLTGASPLVFLTAPLF
jgi:hypothetical protein